MAYFNNVGTLDELKREYRKVALINHPDKGGDLETMKAINAEHDELFEILKHKQNTKAATDETGRTKTTTETAEEFRTVLDLLINLDGLEIELCGSWLWIGGETLQHKDAIKAAGCRWSRNKARWYWHHPEAQTGYRKGNTSMKEIRSKYGSERIISGGPLRSLA